jgi:phosphate acyltransferase
MKVAVDAMGGDHAPEHVVAGALPSKPLVPAQIVLVGPDPRLQEILANAGPASQLPVVHASHRIGMRKAGPLVSKSTREATLPVAVRLLASGTVDAVVSAGNSSAIVATLRPCEGLVHALLLPAPAVPHPAPEGSLPLIDAGGEAQVATVNLAQAILSSRNIGSIPPARYLDHWKNQWGGSKQHASAPAAEPCMSPRVAYEIAIAAVSCL